MQNGMLQEIQKSLQPPDGTRLERQTPLPDKLHGIQRVTNSAGANRRSRWLNRTEFASLAD
jgi:hypothetical protein